MTTLPQLSPEYIEEYSGGRLVALAASLIVIITFFVSLRFYARWLSKTKWGLDDYLVLLSLALLIGASGLAICFVKYAGVGRHLAALEETDPAIVERYWKYLLAVSSYYFAVVAIPKLAILAFYLRVFSLKHYRIIVYILAGIVMATGIVCSIMALNLCRPFAYNWDRSISGGTCVNENAFYRRGSLPNIITDIAMLILPIPIVWKLHTSRNVKVGLTVAFLTGSVGLATSIIRFTSFFHGNAVLDGTWDSVNLMSWTLVEPDVYLIAACLPTYRPLFLHLLEKTRFYLPKSFSGFKSHGSNASRNAPQISSSKLARDGNSAAGFQRLVDDGNGLSKMTLESQLPLVKVSKATMNRQAIPGPNQIRVQNDYDVRISV